MATQIWDPATYIDIEPHQAEVRRTGAPLLWSLASATRRPGMTTIERQVVDDVFDRISDEVLWAATEVLPSDEWKLLSQRYISLGVRDHWLATLASGARAAKAFTRNAKGRVVVKHEHVVPRAVLKAAILRAASEAEVRTQLDRSTACIVTKEEDCRLPAAGNGWERYLGGRVRVFDRKEQRELVLEPLAARSQGRLGDA